MELMFDAVSYILGQTAGAGAVEISGDITCTDDGNGNVTITKTGE